MCVCVGVSTGWFLVIFGADIKTPEPRSLWLGRLCTTQPLSRKSSILLSVFQRLPALSCTHSLGQKDGDTGKQ